MQKIDGIIGRLEKTYTNTKTSLKYSSPLELLVATILSAQCTDATVNRITETLFKKYKTVDDYAMADVQEFEKQIYSTGFYKNKAKSIIESAKIIRKKFNSKVPNNMKDLLELPGVARKTANVVLGEAFGKSEGIVVDTHVKRVIFRLGLTENKNPEKIEQDLIKIVPRDKWVKFPFFIIKLGREACTAKNPQHNKCILNDICPKIGANASALNNMTNVSSVKRKAKNEKPKSSS